MAEETKTKEKMIKDDSEAYKPAVVFVAGEAVIIAIALIYHYYINKG